MFKPTNASTPQEYIEQIDEPRKSEIIALHELIQKAAPDVEPHISYGMLAYGSFHYKYASGKEGDWAIICLASQKNYISLYVSCIKDGHYLAEEYASRLPKANIGKSCVRFNKLADVDTNVLAAMIREAVSLDGQA